MSGKSLCMLRALIASYIVTGILLMVLAFSLYRWNLTQSKVDLGILAIYLISNLVGGFVIGKQMQERKFIWGIVSGVLYFLLLMAVTLVVYHGIQGNTKDVITALFVCAGGGMIGGMIS